MRFCRAWASPALDRSVSALRSVFLSTRLLPRSDGSLFSSSFSSSSSYSSSSLCCASRRLRRPEQQRLEEEEEEEKRLTHSRRCKTDSDAQHKLIHEIGNVCPVYIKEKNIVNWTISSTKCFDMHVQNHKEILPKINSRLLNHYNF